MDEVIVTKHSEKRTKERVGLSKKLADKNAQKALEFGITHGETKSGLKRYLDKLYFNNPSINNLRIYHHYVYLFADNRLVTIIGLPQKYYKLADQLQKQKDEEHEECA